jgi:hypothetical protein
MAKRKAWIGNYLLTGTRELRARLVKRLQYPGGKKARAAAKRIARDFTPRSCKDSIRWAQWFETAERHVAEDILSGGEETTQQLHEEHLPGIRVSTVFLGLDHNYFRGPRPVLFETMVFGGPHDGSTWRYSTWDAAEVGHRRAVLLVRNTSPRLS